MATQALDEYMELSQPLSSVRRSPRKVDKKPVYVLNITIPPREVDNCLEPAKNAVHLQASIKLCSVRGVPKLMSIPIWSRIPILCRLSSRILSSHFSLSITSKPIWRAIILRSNRGKRNGRSSMRLRRWSKVVRPRRFNRTNLPLSQEWATSYILYTKG